MRQENTPIARKPISRKPLWLGFLLSILLHLGIGFWLGELWREEAEEEAFRARLAYYRTQFKPKRLPTAISARDLPQVTSKMEYLDSERVPPKVEESGVELVEPRLPGIEEPEISTGLEEFIVGTKSDTPALARVEMVPPTQMGLADSVGYVEMDLVDWEDLAWANREHAMVMPDPDSRRDITGYINFTRLRLHGAGSDTAGSLDALARFIRDHTGILAQVQDKTYQYFLSEQLLKDPIHFFIQGGGLPIHGDHQLTRFSEKEYALLKRYLREGGFLFIEGNNRFLREMIDHLKVVIGSEGGVSELPLTHPIYQSYYSFESGFPGENKERVTELEQRSWYYPNYNPREVFERQQEALASINPAQSEQQVGAPDYLGLYGVELNGDLVGVISDLQLSSRWAGIFDDEEDDPVGALPVLMPATNIAIYALTRPNGMTVKRELPSWVLKRPGLDPRAGPQRQMEADLVDPDLFADLDAYIALVQSPLGSKIGKGGLDLRLDGRYSLSLFKRGLHGLLLHNLPAGKHWVELSYGGKSKQLEVDLRGGEVLTLTFTLNRLAFFSQLHLNQMEDLVGVEKWRERFTDLQIEEIYLDEERGVLDSGGKF